MRHEVFGKVETLCLDESFVKNEGELLLGCTRKLGSKVRISGLCPQYTPFISR